MDTRPHPDYSRGFFNGHADAPLGYRPSDEERAGHAAGVEHRAQRLNEAQMFGAIKTIAATLGVPLPVSP